MNDSSLPETPREIARAKVALFRHESEFIRSKEGISPTEREWLVWAANRINELESES